MFKKEGGVDDVETIIGPSVQVEGDFVAAGDVIIEGMVSGTIKTEKNLKVGEGAKIFASVTAANALIAGEVQGNVKIKENLELTSTAKIFGDVKTKILTIVSGATLQGKCQAGEERKSKPEKISDSEKSKNKERVKEILDEIPGRVQ
ncbi:MAG: hypothetical protein A3J62_02850 [Candidatus Buchananbacteria bacterium RIFCSPHIGHO2_02_FULL_38_8]|uniref:Cell shape determination protein CcmA n=2 Tax=Candidatus Buchananiibacteriota TaxID=1817903 RepID=A0A1G1XT94_9BACT|nr:MAG: hypothetical protein A2731_02675 [Candidatus Buchananbacteria bacterium RIFCSPHIGHO2_01_FULL_39_8]OGY47920.1 MAG: hypothetical protein A3J62_02850 [Candidatus Buchananbacteria bacterium RIFCSPHIGHO2_02_FULL_38_8]